MAATVDATKSKRGWLTLAALVSAALCLHGCVESHYDGTFDIPTSFGPLHVWDIGIKGKRNKKIALAIHSGMDTEAAHHEFDEVAQKMASYGYHIIIPNFHSLRATRPSTFDQEGMNVILKEVLQWAGGTNFTMLLGKAWGAGMAGGFAAKEPEMVERLVLVAPGILANKGLRNHSIVTETLVLSNQGDQAASHVAMSRVRWLLANEWYHHREYQGGHKWMPEYNKWILRFARRRFLGEDEPSRWGPTEDEPHRPDELPESVEDEL